jgi:hypothetical protein
MSGRIESVRSIRCEAIRKGSKIVGATTIAINLIYLECTLHHTCSRACCVTYSPESPSYRLQIL